VWRSSCPARHRRAAAPATERELVAASTAPDAGLVQVSVVPPKRSDGPIDLVRPSNIQAIEAATIHARTNG
jgi:hypothetical protein